MIDHLTLGDLLRVAAWAGLGTLPIFGGYGMGIEPDKKSDLEKGFWFWMTVASQFGFGVAAYIAGGKI